MTSRIREAAMRLSFGNGVGVFVLTAFLAILSPVYAGAHCDTMDGPVIAEAREALARGDVAPVLKWVKEEHEGEIREVFEKVLTARKASPAAREIADMYFFETLVRLHRAGEGAPYTGLKPAGKVEPIVELSDRALASGEVGELVEHVAAAVEGGIRKRFAHVSGAREEASKSVEAGREFVEAYVIFTHYVERLYLDAAGEGLGHGDE
jgi:hypothetical protein